LSQLTWVVSRLISAYNSLIFLSYFSWSLSCLRSYVLSWEGKNGQMNFKYYIGRDYHGQSVILQVDAANRQFKVELATKKQTVWEQERVNWGESGALPRNCG